MDSDKRNKEINTDRGMAVNRIRHTADWSFVEEVRRDLLKDLKDGLFIPASDGTSLYQEVTYSQIMAHRHGVIEGVNQFFALLDRYESVYLNSKGESE